MARSLDLYASAMLWRFYPIRSGLVTCLSPPFNSPSLILRALASRSIPSKSTLYNHGATCTLHASPPPHSPTPPALPHALPLSAALRPSSPTASARCQTLPSLTSIAPRHGSRISAMACPSTTTTSLLGSTSTASMAGTVSITDTTVSAALSARHSSSSSSPFYSASVQVSLPAPQA